MIKVYLCLLCGAFMISLGAGTGHGTSALVINDTVNPELGIVAPNGGENWFIGETYQIQWNASDSNLIPNSVYIWYSLNGGTGYIPIAEGTANDSTHSWTAPAYQTEAARVRIRVADYFGNFTREASQQSFSISYVPPAEPQNLRVDISNDEDAVITWDAVSHTILPYNYPIVPDGYIVLYNETPSTDDPYFYFLAETDQLEHTHPRVVRFRDSMFYKVIAYKDYDQRMATLLASLKPGDRISLAELRTCLRGWKGGLK
ncbi:MAG TPA: hypothetical protein PKX36_05940 [Candidatus Cloacimonadota bacterium]|nr:hypothetical protein [Candidatus Cloacimonadota bacterium]